MPATGLKLVGTGAVPWCSISSSFQNSLKTPGHQVYDLLDLVLEFSPILGWYMFPAAEEFVAIFDIFCLMMRQMFSIGERFGLQAGQFSTRTLLLQSHAVVLVWRGSCCSKTFIYLSAFIAPSKMCKLPTPYAFMHRAGLSTDRIGRVPWGTRQ